MAAPINQNVAQDKVTNTSPFSLPVPSGIAADDLILVILPRNNTTAASCASDGSDTANFGTAQSPSNAPGGSSVRSTVLWKRAVGDETTITVTATVSTSQRKVAAVLLIRGVDWSFNSGVPIAAPAATATAGGVTGVSPPTATVPGSVVRPSLFISYCVDLGPAFTSTPSGYAAIYSTGTLTSTGLNHVIYEKTATASSDTPGSYGIGSTSSFLAGTIVLVGPADGAPYVQGGIF